MAGFWVYQNSTSRPDPVYLPLGATQTYDNCDPVQISSAQIIESVKDGTEVLEAELVGFAAGGATGNQSNTRQNLSYGNMDSPGTENTMVAFYPATTGLILATTNFFTDATGATASSAIGADIGLTFQICSAAAGDWGLCDVTGTPGTDAAARILAVIEPDGTNINADTTTTDNNRTIVFYITGENLWNETS